MFTDNGAGASGGAIGASQTLIVNQCDFQGNSVINFNGGAISALGVLDIQDSIFSSNVSSFRGGAIFGESAGVTINGSRFTGNRALGAGCTPACRWGHGGAVSALGPLTVTNSTLADNFAKLRGGAISGEGVTAVDACLLTGNKAGTPGDANSPGKGGGIFVTGEAVLTENVFEANAAESPNSDGGGLYGQNGPVQSIGNQFNGNSATRLGGGAHLPGGSVNGDRYLNNTASLEGGGLFTTGNLTITRTIFEGNISSVSGAIQADGPADLSKRLDVDNSLFIRNQNTSSGAAADLSLSHITGRVVNNTFADPGSAGPYSILALYSDLQVNNNIFANYGVSLNGDSGAGGLPVQEDYNLFFNAPPGSAVISGGHSLIEDPLFFNPTALDYRLTTGSPAIGAGLDSALPASIQSDLAGRSRRFGPIDIGAYEFQCTLFLPLIFRGTVN